MNAIASARAQKIGELQKSPGDIGNLDVKILPPGKTDKTPKIQLLTRDGGVFKAPTVVANVVPFLSHAGPTGNFHSEEHGIHGDNRAKIGCFELDKAKYALYIEQDVDGSMKKFYEKVRAALTDFFLDAANAKHTQTYFKALSLKQADEAYTRQVGEQWVSDWEAMTGNTFPALQIPVKANYKDEERFFKKATTRIAYAARSEEEGPASWPESLHGVETSALIDTRRWTYAPPKPMTMFGEAIALETLKDLKEAKGVSIPVHLSMTPPGLFFKDGELMITWYLGRSLTFLASTEELQDPQQLRTTAGGASNEVAFPYMAKPVAGTKRPAEEPAENDAKRAPETAPESPSFAIQSAESAESAESATESAAEE